MGAYIAKHAPARRAITSARWPTTCDRSLTSSTSSCNLCPHMKRITLTNIRDALANRQHEVTVPADIIAPARQALDRMLAVGRKGRPGSSQVRDQRPPAGTIPESSGSYQFKDVQPGHLRGKVEPAPAFELLPGPAEPAASTAQWWRRPRRSSGSGAQRGRGAHARAQPHQAAQAAVQHPAAR